MPSVTASLNVPRKIREKLLKLHVPGTADLPKLHVTLAYFGTLQSIPKAKRLALINAVRSVCQDSRHRTFVAKVGGFLKFAPSESSDGRIPIAATVDSIGLTALAADIDRATQSIVPRASEHGFVPHITIGYISPKHEKEFQLPSVTDTTDWPTWLVDSVNVHLGDASRVRLPLSFLKSLSPDDSIPIGGVPLILNIFKGRKKGSQNKNKHYLMRVEVLGADGKSSYRYVYPDDVDVESYHPTYGFKLKNGKTVTQVVNEKLFGDYGVHRVKDRSGATVNEPYAIPGLFYDYEARYPSPDKKRRYGDPVQENIGKVRFYKYKKIPGFLNIELGPGVSRQYTIPGKVMAFHIDSPEKLEAARKLIPGEGIPEGSGKKLTAEEFHDTAQQHGILTADATISAVRDGNIHAVPPQAETSERAVSEVLPDSVDPLVYAQNPVAYTKDVQEVPTKAKVRPFEDWQIEKYGGEQGLLDAIQRKPGSTIITIAKYAPSQKKIQRALWDEWEPVIRGVSRRAFDAYKVTGRFLRFQETDARKNRSINDPNSSVRKYRNKVLGDLNQHGAQFLYEMAKKYVPSKDPHDTFDKWFHTALERELMNYSAAQARDYSEGLIEPIADEHDEDYLAYRYGKASAGQQDILSPDEQLELMRTQRAAKKAIKDIVNNPVFPETYRRVFLGRLWLDSHESEALESTQIAHRKEIGQKTPVNFERPFTGTGGIAAMYKEWTDPGTGKVIDMSKLSQQAQGYYMNKWYTEASKQVYRQLSVPTEATLREGEIVDRKLSSRGKAFKRWLELETKLLRGNTRLFTEREQHPVTYLPIGKLSSGTATRVPVVPQLPTRNVTGEWTSFPSPVTHERAHPASAFFLEHHELANKLGIKIPGGDTGGLFATPNVSLGTAQQHNLKLAEQYHKNILNLSSDSNQKLSSRAKKIGEALAHLKKIGVAQHPETHEVQWHPKNKLQLFHDTAQEYQRSYSERLRKQAAARAVKKEHKEKAGKITLASQNPFKKKDPIAHAAYQHLVSVGHIKNEAHLDTALDDFMRDSKWNFKNFKKVKRDLRNYLVEHSAVKPGGTDADLQTALKPHLLSDADNQQHAVLKRRLARAGSELSKIKVGDVHVGLPIVQQYMQLIHDPSKKITQEHLNPHKAAIHSALRELHNEQELIKYERQRRATSKGTATVFDLMKAFADHTYVGFIDKRFRSQPLLLKV